MEHIVKCEGRWDTTQDWKDALSGGDKQRVSELFLIYFISLSSGFIDCHGAIVLSVTSVLPKRNRLRETWKRAQPTGCPLSHQCPKKLGSSYGVSQLIFKLREVSSHENWYIYIVRKSRDRWLCTQSQSRKGLCAKVWDVHARWLCTVHDSIPSLGLSPCRPQ